ncbi:hypothetical protein GDO86_007742 [Hymenochirus boettgeri]|uniref:RWD domain-containing protein 3 n=1 Tax=Hymenochirus boettgeri TaxID=247094 RepID=A0A8T2J283_9PIPI|nr:hypothetical protein GDO86_007742 [Hymenochirus boettgeri]KAG8436771.1 hypothetical protein GDO86_007742 [Hymenochirus boettgeri]
MIQTSVHSITGSEIHLRLIFDLPVSYPSCLPNISVSSEELTRAQCKDLRDKLLEQATQHLMEPMIHDLVVWTQQNLNNIIVVPESSTLDGHNPLSLDTSIDEAPWTILIHLDHMRAKSKYVKTVEKWTSDLKLCGRLMFLGKIILILLQGDRKYIKDYLVLQKTCKVDVDSNGKKCKEKMASVLCETTLTQVQKRFSTFEIKEYSSVIDLQQDFESAGLQTIFTQFVQPLF